MTALPPVTAQAATAALDALPARLRKRLDGAVAALDGCVVSAGDPGDGSRVRVAIDEETAVVLTLTAGVVVAASDVTCSCLLAPNCLHRAAVLASAPVADERSGQGDLADSPGDPAAAGASGGSDAPEAAPAPEVPGAADRAVVVLGEQARQAARELWAAAAAVVEAGLSGSGAVRRTALLRAAHGARIAGLPYPASIALRVARQLTEARTGDPAFRLPRLAADLASLLDRAGTLADAEPGADVTAVAGTARRGYRPAGSLRLHGLFTESVVTASGYAGAVAFAVAADGTRHTIADVMPGGPERALSAAGSPVPGGCALSLRELGAGAGLLATGATVSPDGRIGGGGGIRTVRARAVSWYDEPVAALWDRPLARQLHDVLAWWEEPEGVRAAGGDLLFLDGTLVPADGGAAVAVDDGPLVRLHAADERLELPYAGNLRLLAGAGGLRVRLIARLEPERPGSVAALAVCWRDREDRPVRVDLGLRSLSRSALPEVPPGQLPVRPGIPAPPVELDLLYRVVTRTVEGGRAITAAAADDRLAVRLRAVGLVTGASCVAELTAAAADRRQDALGRLRAGGTDVLARGWLATALYATAASRSLLASGWLAEEAG